MSITPVIVITIIVIEIASTIITIVMTTSIIIKAIYTTASTYNIPTTSKSSMVLISSSSIKLMSVSKTRSRIIGIVPSTEIISIIVGATAITEVVLGCVSILFLNVSVSERIGTNDVVLVADDVSRWWSNSAVSSSVLHMTFFVIVIIAIAVHVPYDVLDASRFRWVLEFPWRTVGSW